MDRYEFIVRLVEALAWPLVALLVALLLRNPIITLLKNLEKIKWQGTELEFGKQLVSAEKDAKKLSLPSAEKLKLPAFKQGETLYEKMKAIAEISPAAAISDSWKAVELATLEVSKARGYNFVGAAGGYRVIESLINEELLDKEALDLYQNLRKLRNSATHHSDFLISSSEALRYIDLALSLANILHNITELDKSPKRKKKIA